MVNADSYLSGCELDLTFSLVSFVNHARASASWVVLLYVVALIKMIPPFVLRFSIDSG